MGCSADDQPLSPAQLAREAGISASVLRNWARKFEPPLERLPDTGRAVLHTWAHLRAFCESHPDLPAVRKINHLRALSTASPEVDAARSDPEQTRTVIRNLRAIAVSNLNATLIAARAAERAATAHREQLEALATSLNGYDDLLTQITTPTTLND